jgi:polysaccharide pyruvyl transferase WcaK-like protein
MKLMFDQSGYALGNLGDRAMLEMALARCSEHECIVVARNEILLRGVSKKANLVEMAGLTEWRRTYNLAGGIHRLLPQSAHQTLKDLEEACRSKFPHMAYKHIVRRLKKRNADTEPFERFMKQVSETDALIVTGGGFINDSFPRHAMLVLRLCQLFLRLGKPVALFGQGIGPLKTPALRKVLAEVAQQATVFGLREGLYSPVLLKELGVTNPRVVTTGDDAIEFALQYTEIPTKNSIGINIRVAPYSGISEEVAMKILQSVEYAKNQLGCSLVAVPISWNAGDSDVSTLSFIEPEICLDKPWSTQQLVDRVSECRVVITASYHAAVFALSQGCPVIAMVGSGYYDAKMKGLAKQFDCNESSLRLMTPEQLCDRQQMTLAISELIQSIGDVADKLQEKASDQSTLSQNLFEEFLIQAQASVAG